MKLRTAGPALFTLVALCTASAAWSDVPPEFRSREGTKPSTESKGQKGSMAPLSGGDTIPNATVIPALPYVDSGGTCGANDDYPPVCWVTPGAPDVVYKYTPPTNGIVTISLCNSNYDTALLLVRGTDFVVLRCADDVCGLQSRIENVPLIGNIPYYIIVDGWGESCGEYQLTVAGPCELECPPGAIAEGEPDCARDYVDNYDGGCVSVPAVFKSIACSDEEIVVCGRFGTYRDAIGPLRDTDWYEIVLDSDANLEVSVVAEAPTQLAILNAAGGCVGFTVACGSVFAEACITGTCSAFLSKGTYWIFVSPNAFGGVPCGTEYDLRIRGYECSLPPPPPPGQGMYGSTRSGQLLSVNTSTGAASLLANLPTFGSIGAAEIEYDGNTKIAYLQGVDGSFAMQKFDIDSGVPFGSPVDVGAAFDGLEVVGSQLYGTGHTGPCAPSFLATIDPSSGAVNPIGSTGLGPITGLAFDDGKGVLYGITGCASGNSLLVNLDRTTGAATVVGPTGFEAASLEFGEDGVLYGGGSTEDGGRLYRIDLGTGAGTLIGPSGFPSLTGLTLVPKTTPVTQRSWGAIKAKYHR
ncbi:MAG: hypothetical protein ACREOU_01840 [Candidatus Eiseniibacteriota bacterium]